MPAKRVDPFRNFRFRVEIDGLTTAGFNEATIADTTVDVVEYREGTDPTHQRKLSGMAKSGNITLKKGLNPSLELMKWSKQVVDTGATSARKNLSLILVDEEGNDAARWDVVEAWPTKYDPSDLSAKGNEVLVESFELVHEGISRVK